MKTIRTIIWFIRYGILTAFELRHKKLMSCSEAVSVAWDVAKLDKYEDYYDGVEL